MSTPGSEVKVFGRTRPTANFAQDIIEYLPDGQTVNVHLRKDSKKEIVNNQLNSWSFRLDRILYDASQEEVYNSVAQDVVLGALDGYNGTVMCFGQTGAGKTYTMTGATESYKERGIIPRALQEVFQEVDRRPDHIITVRLSFLEIYNETLLDLLSTVREAPAGGSGVMAIVDEGGGVTVRGLSMHLVHNEEEALNLLFEGEMNRIIGAHTLNKNSSRSHCIFTVHIESHSRILSDAKYVTSKLNLVDLAGSERLGKTGSDGQILKETMYINKSLSFLEQAVLALADRRRDHVPFRQSKLTHALKDSLGGNCNTVLVANIYGEAAQIEETLSTLRFASRMKCIQTAPAVNEHIDPVLQVKKLQKEIQLLKQELSIQDTLANRTGISYNKLTETQVAEIQSQVRGYLDGTMDEIEIVSIRQVQEVFAQFKLALQQQENKSKAEMNQNSTLEGKAQNTQSSTNVKGLSGVVGDVEGPGFGVGMAPPPEKINRLQSPHRTRTKKAKELNRKEGAGSPAQVKEMEVLSTSRMNPLLASQKDMEGQEPEMQSQDSQGPQTVDWDHIRPDSPPPKAAAFEEFKAERGSEINRILKENKAVLAERRRRLRELTDGVNVAKREIDSVSAELQRCKEQSQHQGRFVSVEGESALEEAELSSLLRLKELKGQYRQLYKELCDTKAEVNYCEHLVDQCRIRLFSEFESWYNESFLIPEETQAILKTRGSIRPGLIPMVKALALEGDEQERFERLRSELLASSRGAISYHNAYDRTLQRRNYGRTTTQTLQQRTNSGDSGRTKLPAILSIT